MDRVKQNHMTVVGLTGTIASGKSTVARFFQEWGAVVLDADEIGHEVVHPGKRAWRQIVEAFGDGVLLPHGEIDRDFLGQLVFHDPVAREKLNGIVHPRLVSELKKRIEVVRSRGFPGIVVVDAALLPLWEVTSLVERLIVVRAAEEHRIQRLIVKNGFSKADAEARLHAQEDLEKRLQQADFVIVNDGTVAKLRKAARKVWTQLTRSRR